MATFQLAPPLFSKWTPSVKQISSCAASSGIASKVMEKALVAVRTIAAETQSSPLVEKW